MEFFFLVQTQFNFACLFSIFENELKFDNFAGADRIENLRGEQITQDLKGVVVKFGLGLPE